MSQSVIIPYHSHELHLTLCIAAVTRTVPETCEIIIVANNDDSGYLPELPDDSRIKLIDCGKSLGYSRAINRGASEASGEILFLCDADVYPMNGWMEPHLRALEQNPQIGFTASKLLDSQTGRVLDFGIGRTSLNHIHPGRGLPRAHPLVRQDRVVQMACSALAGVPRELFLDVGGMDESLRYFYQDTDLTVRITASGFQCYCLSESLAYHKGSSSDIERGPYQTDERGLYTANNMSRLQVNFGDYLDDSLRWVLGRREPAEKYLWVNLSTIHPFGEYEEVLLPHLPPADLVNLPVPARDWRALSLLQYLTTRIHQSELPFLLLVDRLDSLIFNRLFLATRSNPADIAIDRHGNAAHLQDLDQW